MGYGNQPYLVFKHEDINRHHLHIVTVRVDENGRSIDTRNNFYAASRLHVSWNRSTGFTMRNAGTTVLIHRCTRWTLRQAM